MNASEEPGSSGPPASKGEVTEVLGTLLLVTVLLGIAMIVGAVWQGELSWLKGAVGVLGIAGVVAALMAVVSLGRKLGTKLEEAVRTEGAPQFEVHWGGLGGGVSGWSISRSMVLLVAMVLLGVILLAAVSQLGTLGAAFLNEGNAAEKPAKPATVVSNVPPKAKEEPQGTK